MAVVTPRLVIKLGGALVEREAWMSVFAEVLPTLTTDVTLVHGGGREIDALLEKLAIKPAKINGRRVTDDATMEVVEMVLAGKVQGAMVRGLHQAGVRAVGLSGCDGALAVGRVLDPSLGRVGELTTVRSALLEQLLLLGMVPVLTPLATDMHGEALNINGDDFAAGIAAALFAERLLLLTDTPGLLDAFPDEGSRVPEMSIHQLRTLRGAGKVERGMIPKIEAAEAAIRGGVQEVLIADGRSAEAFSAAIRGDGSRGTWIRR